METDELIKAVMDRFSPDELCDLMEITTTEMADKFYDEILSSSAVLEALGLDPDDATDGLEPDLPWS